jgi:hypothetical protein
MSAESYKQEPEPQGGSPIYEDSGNEYAMPVELIYNNIACPACSKPIIVPRFPPKIRFQYKGTPTYTFYLRGTLIIPSQDIHKIYIPYQVTDPTTGKAIDDLFTQEGDHDTKF